MSDMIEDGDFFKIVTETGEEMCRLRKDHPTAISIHLMYLNAQKLDLQRAEWFLQGVTQGCLYISNILELPSYVQGTEEIKDGPVRPDQEDRPEVKEV